jgi:hypothetical protein
MLLQIKKRIEKGLNKIHQLHNKSSRDLKANLSSISNLLKRSCELVSCHSRHSLKLFFWSFVLGNI